MSRAKIVAPFLALAMVTGASVYGYPSGAAAAESNKDQIKLSDDAFAAMRAVRDARLAIFNGKTDAATAMEKKAKTSLQAVEKDAASYSVKKGEVEYIPVDVQISLVDNFVATPEKLEHIKKANEHFKAGEKNQAIEELKQGEVDVNYVRVLMPLAATKTHVDKASALLAEQKYYEANLALKAAEDGILIDTVSMVGLPAE